MTAGYPAPVVPVRHIFITVIAVSNRDHVIGSDHRLAVLVEGSPST